MNENKMILMWSVILIVIMGFFALNPPAYKIENAKGLGDVIRSGDQVYNQKNLDDYVVKVQAKKAADIRLVSYNEAGVATISKLSYDGYNIKLTVDARRDKSKKGLWKITKSHYATIEKTGTEYYLVIPDVEKKLIFTGK